jgi:hypothetical protein
VTRQEGSYDVLTEKKVDRPILTDPKILEKAVSVAASSTAVVDFTIGEKWKQCAFPRRSERATSM